MATDGRILVFNVYYAKKSHPRFTHLGKTRMKSEKRLLWPENNLSLIRVSKKRLLCHENHSKSLIRVLLPKWVNP